MLVQRTAGAVGVALGFDFDLVGDHEGAVEAQAEVADDLRVFAAVLLAGVFGDEVVRAGERDLRDVLLDFLGRHADAVVGELQRSGRLVDHDVDAVRRVVALRLAGRHQPLVLADGVAAIADHFADEDVLV